MKSEYLVVSDPFYAMRLSLYGQIVRPRDRIRGVKLQTLSAE